QNWNVFISFPNIVVLPKLMNSIIHSTFAGEGAEDDEGSIDRGAAHDKSVEAFERTSSASSSSGIHG
ncbi:hypothetical protein, partial [Enterococcus faecium]